ncbi:hypothetical protein [Demequina sp.]|uniref:hypothetical protein n=1 Tax=Demequina sp. TaxID=2050685 RepID=UPI003D0EF316
MDLVIDEDAATALPFRRLTPPAALAWPVCGRVVDVSGGPSGRPLRCHLSHGHRGNCDDLGSSELEHWQASSTTPATSGETLDGVKVLALAQARTYEAVSQWKRERGADEEAGQLLAMADALRRLVLVLDR